MLSSVFRIRRCYSPVPGAVYLGKTGSDGMERGILMSHSLFDLTGRVALVSGTARGLGRAMALGFAEAGADLLLADINTQGNEATAAHIKELGRRALPAI